jgi:L-glutamine:2-deoxy-scyllo-inosose/3-amino-2,3-dideoxy-scyllo-inosose aminotransferase
MELVELGELMGCNRCMSELHAALLLDQLPRLDTQHAQRESNAAVLEAGLCATGDFWTIPVPRAANRRSIYEYGIRFRHGTFGDLSVEQVAAELAYELERPVYPPDVPLYRSLLFRPETNRRFGAVWTPEGRARAIGREFPNAEAFRDTALLLHHSALLGDVSDVRDIVDALLLVRDRHTEARRAA